MEILYISAIILVGIAMFFIGNRYGAKSAGDISIYTEKIASLNAKIEEENNKIKEQESIIERKNEAITTLTSERDVQRAKAENLAEQMREAKEKSEELLKNERAQSEQILANQKHLYEKQIEEIRTAFTKQLEQVKEAQSKQIETLKEMNREQIENQLTLIKEQMQTTSENVLKMRQEELGEANLRQVSKIVDPLQESLKLMREALADSKEKHQEALHKLDATIQANMKNSADLGETAARLTRALTGEVKAQGNFGELKLRQLLEDLGLKDGEQFSSQMQLRDRLGKAIKDDEGKGLIPDFVLHFPDNRDVVVDSKMSFTAYERYINCEDPDEQSQYLKEHLISIRAQIDRLAKKDYSKYLKEGYGKLNFVIMYVHTEGALNLALLNDGALWREAYDKGVLLLGPQTMYMNLRVLELMWTQTRQLQNQEEMIKAANLIVERTQDFAIRFADVEAKMHDTVRSIDKLKITTGESGQSIVTAAKKLIKAGARESKKKKSLSEMSGEILIEEQGDN